MRTSATKRPVVLIVEDDFLLRMNAAEMNGDAGFDVIEAGNADEASQFWKRARAFTSSLLISKCPAQWMA
jgi:CheY-like chemotaxis protein